MKRNRRPSLHARGLSIRTLCLLIVAISPTAASAEDALLEDRIAMAREAEEAGDYGGAARILREARQSWPGDPRLPVLLGDLYTGRGLHSLALDEYLTAESLSPGDMEILQRIADGYGFLNREEDSIRYLRRILERDPGNVRATGDLGWMLFKTHKLAEGTSLLEDAERRMGPDMGFSMTLGTLKAELFDYEGAKRRYSQAISLSRAEGYTRFASVGYYNLSLLESRFRFWEKAMNAADLSILMEPRSSGYLARGDFHLRRMEIGKAAEDFQRAYSLDTTPLARLSLAEAALMSGRLEEALAWVKEVAALEEHPWMASFGTDPDSFAMDLHRLQWDIYRGRANREGIRPKKGIGDSLASLFRRGADRVRSIYHELLFRKSARVVARSYKREGAELPAAINASAAFRSYPRIAEGYLREARSLETSYVPGAAASYDLEEAALHRDAAAISEALARLDPVWERDVMADGLGELAGTLSRRARLPERRAALEALWLINPSALPQRGCSVPALVSLDLGPGASPAFGGRLGRQLRRLGMNMAGDRDEAFAFSLNVRVGLDGAEYALVSRSTGAPLKKGRIFLGGSITDKEACLLADYLFRSLHEIPY